MRQLLTRSDTFDLPFWEKLVCFSWTTAVHTLAPRRSAVPLRLHTKNGKPMTNHLSVVLTDSDVGKKST
jgi:hypothetical protein